MRHVAVPARLLLSFALVRAPGLAAQARPLSFGQRASAYLGAPGDPSRSGRPYNVWTLTADSTGPAEIAMHADGFDAYLVLQDADGHFIAYDNDGGGGRDARLVHDLTAGTRYRIVARSLSDSAGAYTISVRHLGADTEGVVGAVMRGQTVTGTLAQGGPTVSGERPYQAWTIDVLAGDSVVIDLTSEAFDTFLILQDAVGRSLDENDDFGDGLNSHLDHRFAAGGRYRIVVTGFAASAAGPYRLQVR